VTKRKSQSVRFTISGDAVKKFFSKAYQKAKSPVALGLLIAVCVLLGSKLSCGCNKQGKFWWTYGYTPPNPKEVMELIK